MSNPNAAQQDFWSTAQGQNWVEHETALDASMDGILDRLIVKANLKPAEHILDVGCGTGASTREIAEAVGQEGRVTGLDISQPMVERARVKSDKAGITNSEFKLSDAQTHPFEPNTYHAILSRFGVMFFADPVAAFRNMATGLKSNGRIIFASWAPISHNPWFLIPRNAAVSRLGKPSPADPHAPGPLAFQDVGRVKNILSAAGLTDVHCETETVPMRLPGTAKSVANLVTKIGPATRIIAELNGDDADQTAIANAIETAFKDFETDDGVVIGSTINYYSARRS
jgi:SAM-dependent methyltransferase